MWNTGLIVLLGAWMMAAAMMLPDPAAQAWNSRIIGIMVIGLTLASPRAYRWEVFAAGAAAAWLFASSFAPALRIGGDFVWNNVVSGVLLIVLATRATMKTAERVEPKLPP